jgi:hypothetical protein
MVLFIIKRSQIEGYENPRHFASRSKNKHWNIAVWGKRGVNLFQDFEGYGHRNRIGFALEEYFHRDPDLNSG